MFEPDLVQMLFSFFRVALRLIPEHVALIQTSTCFLYRACLHSRNVLEMVNSFLRHFQSIAPSLPIFAIAHADAARSLISASMHSADDRIVSSFLLRIAPDFGQYRAKTIEVLDAHFLYQKVIELNAERSVRSDFVNHSLRVALEVCRVNVEPIGCLVPVLIAFRGESIVEEKRLMGRCEPFDCSEAIPSEWMKARKGAITNLTFDFPELQSLERFLEMNFPQLRVAVSYVNQLPDHLRLMIARVIISDGGDAISKGNVNLQVLLLLTSRPLRCVDRPVMSLNGAKREIAP